MTENGKGWLMVVIAFVIGAAISGLAYYYTNYVL